MLLNFTLSFVLCVLAVVLGERAAVLGEYATTTIAYEVEVPGADSIRIVEGEPLWHRDARDDPLKKFLEEYAEKIKTNHRDQNKDETMESIELIKPEGLDHDKGKSWHNRYTDTKKGWISMEPVPWSVSKISKWQSKYKPSTPKPWDEYDSQETQVRPWTRPYESHTSEEKKPFHTRPTAIFNQKVHVNYSPSKYHQHTDDCTHKKQQFDTSEIITDGMPANFPHLHEANRRQGTEIHPDTHPFSGEGEWVLLSTTKGYKYPRQRSLQITADVGTKTGVGLTVLPPLKNSKVNMTTSHGGLIQVDSTMQTVEQARRQQQKNKKQKVKRKNPKLAKPVKQVVPQKAVTTQRNSRPDTSAVLAAVGAGMIPATMAMLVPMALGGR